MADVPSTAFPYVFPSPWGYGGFVFLFFRAPPSVGVVARLEALPFPIVRVAGAGSRRLAAAIYGPASERLGPQWRSRA